MKFNTLADLKQVQKQLAQAHEQAAAKAAALAAAARQAEADKNLFSKAVGAVTTLPDKKQMLKKPVAVPPVAKQRQKDEEAVLRDALSDDFDVSTLLDTDDMLSFRRPGIGPDVTHKLRKGEWSIQKEIDLHGLRSDEARLALATFIQSWLLCRPNPPKAGPEHWWSYSSPGTEAPLTAHTFWLRIQSAVWKKLFFKRSRKAGSTSVSLIA